MRSERASELTQTPVRAVVHITSSNENTKKAPAACAAAQKKTHAYVARQNSRVKVSKDEPKKK